MLNSQVRVVNPGALRLKALVHASVKSKTFPASLATRTEYGDATCDDEPCGCQTGSRFALDCPRREKSLNQIAKDVKRLRVVSPHTAALKVCPAPDFTGVDVAVQLEEVAVHLESEMSAEMLEAAVLLIDTAQGFREVGGRPSTAQDDWPSKF